MRIKAIRGARCAPARCAPSDGADRPPLESMGASGRPARTESPRVAGSCHTFSACAKKIRTMRYGGFFKFRELATCRVCGETFRPVRFDAITCTDTCRKRLQRGGAFAYLADLSPMERRAERKRHALHDQTIDSTRKVMAERRERLRLDPNRPLRVQKRQQAAERKRVAEEVARQQRRARAKLDMEQQRPRNDNLGMVVVGAIMLFVKQRRNASAPRRSQRCWTCQSTIRLS